MRHDELAELSMEGTWMEDDWGFLQRMKHFLIGSGALHLVALVYLLSNPSWMKPSEAERTTNDDPVLTHIPAHIVDQLLQPSRPASAVPDRIRPDPEPPVTVPPREAVKQPEVRKPLNPDPVSDKPTETPRNEVKTPHKIKISTEVVKADPRPQPQSQKQPNLNTQKATALNQAVNKLSAQLSSSTQVDMKGVFSAAMASYASVVKTVYNQAWVAPADLDDTKATVQVEIVILRSGNVKSSRIVSKSNNTVLDQSVQKTLNNVRFVRPFPEGSDDLERTFVINFNLKSKGLL